MNNNEELINNQTHEITNHEPIYIKEVKPKTDRSVIMVGLGLAALAWAPIIGAIMVPYSNYVNEVHPTMQYLTKEYINYVKDIYVYHPIFSVGINAIGAAFLGIKSGIEYQKHKQEVDDIIRNMLSKALNEPSYSKNKEYSVPEQLLQTKNLINTNILLYEQNKSKFPNVNKEELDKYIIISNELVSNLKITLAGGLFTSNRSTIDKIEHTPGAPYPYPFDYKKVSIGTNSAVDQLEFYSIEQIEMERIKMHQHFKKDSKMSKKVDKLYDSYVNDISAVEQLKDSKEETKGRGL